MDLLQFLPDQSFECSECAKCCTCGWRVHVDPHSQRRVSGSVLELRVIQETGGPAIVTDESGALRTASRGDGSCVFLDEQRLCMIHSEIAREAKPITCLQFPFVVRPTPDGVKIGISFFCTSAQRNSGRPLATYEPELRELLRAMKYKPVGEGPIPVFGEAAIDWPTYRAFRESLDAHLLEGSPSRGLGLALVAVCRWLDDPSASLVGRLEERKAPPSDGTFVMMQSFFVTALIGLLEVDDSSHARGITEALMQGADVSLPRFGWSGPSLEIGRYGSMALGEWIDPELTRYLRALVFREFLAMDRPLLVNLATMYLLPALLRWYISLAALSRGAERAERQDLFRAFDVAEKELVTHASGIDRMFEAFAEAFRDELRAAP